MSAFEVPNLGSGRYTAFVAFIAGLTCLARWYPFQGSLRGARRHLDRDYLIGKAKCRSNSRRDNSSPSGLSTTDFALLFGSEMYPRAWIRSSASQSWDFHVRAPQSFCSVMVRYNSASTISSTFSLS